MSKRPHDTPASRNGHDAEELTDHAYFRNLEELFIGLRGSPLLLSPADWEMARKWRREEVPLDVVERVLREIFDRKPESKGRSGIRSLKYFDSAVARAWREIRELGVVNDSRKPEPLDIASRLAALATAIPDTVDGSDELRVRVLALEGSAEDVESRLSELNQELLDRADLGLDSRTRSEVAAEVELALARLSSRIAPDERDVLVRQLGSRVLRRRLSLPVLSLFSPEASGSPPSSESESV